MGFFDGLHDDGGPTTLWHHRMSLGLEAWRTGDGPTHQNELTWLLAQEARLGCRETSAWCGDCLSRGDDSSPDAAGRGKRQRRGNPQAAR